MELADLSVGASFPLAIHRVWMIATIVDSNDIEYQTQTKQLNQVVENYKYYIATCSLLLHGGSIQ